MLCKILPFEIHSFRFISIFMFKSPVKIYILCGGSIFIFSHFIGKFYNLAIERQNKNKKVVVRTK